ASALGLVGCVHAVPHRLRILLDVLSRERLDLLRAQRRAHRAQRRHVAHHRGCHHPLHRFCTRPWFVVDRASSGSANARYSPEYVPPLTATTMYCLPLTE